MVGAGVAAAGAVAPAVVATAVVMVEVGAVTAQMAAAVEMGRSLR